MAANFGTSNNANNKFGGSSSGPCRIRCARCSIILPPTAGQQEQKRKMQTQQANGGSGCCNGKWQQCGPKEPQIL
jgi:hypothetical protein